jgi:ribonuclease HII
MRPDRSHERALMAAGAGIVAGLDEVGRGPLAGPVFACALVLPDDLAPDLAGAIDDSKRLAPARRAELAAALERVARIGLGQASPAEIDRLNILEATFLAMRRAVAALGAPPPDHALVDGNRAPNLACPATALVGGDARCLSIAAASIVAKVRRDRLMATLAERHPGYGWERNAGYGTQEHLAALARLGATPHHRRSFAPVAAAAAGAPVAATPDSPRPNLVNDLESQDY